VSEDYTPEPTSGWVAGGVMFAAVMMVLIGSFEVIAGLTAIFDDEFFVVGANYTFELDTTAWGWIHLLLGALVVLAGAALFSGAAWAGIVALVLAVLAAIANFFFIPYYPFWAILEIALACWVIWALTRPGVLR
jgi:hypothetical protein